MRNPLTPDERFLTTMLGYLGRPSINQDHWDEKLKMRAALTAKYADILERKYSQWKFTDPDDSTRELDQRLDVYASDLRKRSAGYEPSHSVSAELATLRAEIEQLRRERDAIRNETLEAAKRFDVADWYWRTLDPDDSADNPGEALNRGMVPNFVVCEVASSFSGPTRYGFNALVLDPESDDEEFLHFATQEEAIAAAKERAAAILRAKEPSDD